MAIKVSGNFNNTERFLTKAKKIPDKIKFDDYAKLGIKALEKYTPVRSGKTKKSWTYNIVKKRGSVKIEWINLNINKGINIAVIIEYGHKTRNGGYVKGLNYIDPALTPVFEKLKNDIWKEVTSK